MITGTFSGVTLIAEGKLDDYNQQGHQTLKKGKSVTMKMHQDGNFDSLFEKLKFKYNENFVPLVGWGNKLKIDNFNINSIKRNVNIDMTEINAVHARLNSQPHSKGNLNDKEKKLLMSIST